MTACFQEGNSFTASSSNSFSTENGGSKESNNTKKHKLMFQKFDAEATKTLKEHFKKNKYPKREELKKIADNISESISKVQNWFKYYRIKTNSIIPSLKKKKICKEIAHCLEKEYADNPFPSIDRLKELGKKYDLKAKKISDWFSYKRRKAKRENKKESKERSFSSNSLPNTSQNSPYINGLRAANNLTPPTQVIAAQQQNSFENSFVLNHQNMGSLCLNQTIPQMQNNSSFHPHYFQQNFNQSSMPTSQAQFVYLVPKSANLNQNYLANYVQNNNNALNLYNFNQTNEYAKYLNNFNNNFNNRGSNYNYQSFGLNNNLNANAMNTMNSMYNYQNYIQNSQNLNNNFNFTTNQKNVLINQNNENPIGLKKEFYIKEEFVLKKENFVKKENIIKKEKI